MTAVCGPEQSLAAHLCSRIEHFILPLIVHGEYVRFLENARMPDHSERFSILLHTVLLLDDQIVVVAILQIVFDQGSILAQREQTYLARVRVSAEQDAYDLFRMRSVTAQERIQLGGDFIVRSVIEEIVLVNRESKIQFL